MPLPPHVFSGASPARRPVGGWLRRLFATGSQRKASTRVEPRHIAHEDSAAPDVLIDADTRTFWGSAGAAPATVVEIPADDSVRRGRHRVDALVEAHEAGRDRIDMARPRGNPAFSEALFVELMRAHQYKRAFELLTPDCQSSWGSAHRFAAAQGSGAMRRLRGVNVRDVRYLQEWTDPVGGTTYHEVAELKVEYTVGELQSATVLPRVVHLVPDGGRWRSLCYP